MTSNKFLAGIVGAWIMALALTVFAQPQPDAGRVFNNPFISPRGKVGMPPGSTPEDRDDEDEEDDAPFTPPSNVGRPAMTPPSAPTFATPPPSNRAITLGTPKPANDVPQPKRGGTGIEVGGEAGGGIKAGQPVNSIPVETESGKGGKEIVTDFNFPDADILDIAKTLGKLTGKNFILDKDVKGRITIISNSAITVGDAWKAFLTALDINGFTLIPSGEYIRIARQRDARDKQLSLYVDDSPATDQLITRVFPLKHIGAEEVERAFRSFIPATARLVPYAQTNSIIVVDTGHNIAKLAKMLELLDVEGYDTGIEVVQVKYASAVELAKLIETLLPGTGGARVRTGTSGARFSAPPVPGGGSAGQGKRTKEGGIIQAIIADERTNTLIVHANQKGVEQVQTLVAKLDRRLTTAQGGGKIHVVYLQFAEAEEVAKTLNSLEQGGKAAPRSSSTQGGLGVNPTEQNLFEGSIKVAPDKATNSLVISASPTDFSTVQRVIAKLDIPRDEVFVEALIMEMTLSKDFSFSTNLAAPTTGLFLTPNTDLLTFLTSPASQKGFVFGAQLGGGQNILVNGVNVPIKDINGVIKAIQTNSNANILATPQIMTLDNKEATFEANERIPVLSTTTNNGVVNSATSKENIGLSMTIKPQINKVSNFVSLDIKTQLEDIQNRELPKAVADQAFATTQRKASTTLVVGDGDTVVLGGLIRDKVSDQVSKIPILGDIPLLGWLFSAKTQAVAKTNLLIFITPHIIRQYDKVRAVLDKKLKQRDDFLEATTGGDDPHRRYRDDMIRSLPDAKSLAAQQPYSPRVSDDVDDLTPSAPGAGTPAPATPPGPQFQPQGQAPATQLPPAQQQPQSAAPPALVQPPPPATAEAGTPAPATPSVAPQAPSSIPEPLPVPDTADQDLDGPGDAR